MPRPLARVLALLEILQTGGTHQLSALSGKLGVDQRTVRRYVDHLLDLSIPVESTRGRYGGYRLAPGFRLPPLMLTDDEALAVLVGLAASEPEGASAGSSATAKILRVLPEASRARFEALLLHADLSAARSGAGRGFAPTETSVLLTVAEAAGRRQPLRLSYADRDGRGSHRIVLPYGVVARAGRWYLSGADSLSGEVRTFRVDRIRSAEPQDGAFEVPKGLDPSADLESALASTPWRYAVSVRVEASADHVRSRLPAGLAVVTELAADDPEAPGPSFEGWVRVTLRAQRLDWLPAILAGLDRPFIVDEPAELRERVRILGERLIAIARARNPNES